MGFEKHCCLCGKDLKYNVSNRRALQHGLPTTTDTHDPAAKSKAHIGHVSGRRGRSGFPSISAHAWEEMGIANPKDTAIMCYECHEEVLHNPVFSQESLNELGQVFQNKSFEAKVVALNKIITAGIKAIRLGAAADRREKPGSR